MTTIVYRDGILVADTSVWDRGCYVGQIVKVWGLSDGRLAGASGPMGECALFRDWFLAGASEDFPDRIKNDNFEGMIFSPDGDITWYGNERAPVHVVGEYHAIGSGFRIALGAMAAGASAERAMEIVGCIDDGTRAPFTVLRHAEFVKGA